MNGQALVDRAELRFGDTTNAVYSEVEWLAYVNDAYMDVITAAPSWPFMESRDTSLEVTSSGSTTLPDDVWRITAVYNATDGISLAPIPGQAEYRRYFPQPAEGLGMPLFYRLQGRTLEVYPFPAVTTALHLDVLVPPAEVTLVTEPIFAEQWHRILVLGALAKAYEDDENPQQAAVFQGRFDRMLRDMQMDLLSPRTEGSHVIQDVGA